MEKEKTDSESFIERMKEILNANLDMKDLSQFQMMADAISITTATANIFVPTEFNERGDEFVELYWGLKYSQDRMSVRIHKGSICDLDCRIGSEIFYFPSIPLAAAVAILDQELKRLRSLRIEPEG